MQTLDPAEIVLQNLDLPPIITLETLRTMPMLELRQKLGHLCTEDYRVAMKLRAKLKMRNRARETTRLYRELASGSHCQFCGFNKGVEVDGNSEDGLTNYVHS